MRPGLGSRLRSVRAITGALLHPLAAYLLLRGLPTLPLRVRAQQQTRDPGRGVPVRPPDGQRRCTTRAWPGRTRGGCWVASRPGRAACWRSRCAAASQRARAVAGAVQADHPRGVARRRRLAAAAPGALTHRPVEAGAKPAGGLLRLSCGLEDVEDLVADLDQALLGRCPLTAGLREDGGMAVQGVHRITVSVADLDVSLAALPRRAGAGRAVARRRVRHARGAGRDAGAAAPARARAEPGRGGREPGGGRRRRDDEAAVAAGATLLDAPQDQSWGERQAVLLDPDGHVLCLVAPLPPAADLSRRAGARSGPGARCAGRGALDRHLLRPAVESPPGAGGRRRSALRGARAGDDRRRGLDRRSGRRTWTPRGCRSALWESRALVQDLRPPREPCTCWPRGSCPCGRLPSAAMPTTSPFAPDVRMDDPSRPTRSWRRWPTRWTATS